MLTALAAAMALQAETPAASPAPVRTLKDIPGVTVSYYDVAGKNLKALNQSLKKQRPIGSNGEPNAVGSTWKIGASVQKQTEGEKCSVVGAKVTLEAKVELPRLANPAAVEAKSLTAWNDFAGGLEKMAAMDLGFLTDHMPDIEKAMIGQSCNAVSGAMNAAIDRLTAQEKEYMAAATATPTAQK
jgi:predicted secreted Zn-dependent protease